MTEKDFDDIATLTALAEGDAYVDFTCHILERMGRADYSRLFNHGLNNGIAPSLWVVNSDLEFNGMEDENPAYQGWRRTALAFAAAMIATGDL